MTRAAATAIQDGPAGRATRAIARAVGLATAEARMTPSFLVAGSQRCGTTSMYQALSQHGSVLPGVRCKGVHYFDLRYHHSRRWYLSHFPLLAHQQWLERKAGSPVLTFEASSYYMFHPLAGERIARDLPGVRLVVMLRDPVERAFSAHAHELARGFETEPFERALELEPERTAGEEERLRADPTAHSFHHQHHSYLVRGRYAEQLDRLAELFGRERIHVLESEEFFSDPAPVFASVTRFLGLPDGDGVRFERRNARPRGAMPARLRARLEEYYAPHNARLVQWLGHSPTWCR